jgi:hypothetical protein
MRSWTEPTLSTPDADATAQRMHKVHLSVTEALRPEGSPRTFAGALSEEKALKQVTEFLGEAVVFGVRRRTRTTRKPQP